MDPAPRNHEITVDFMLRQLACSCGWRMDLVNRSWPLVILNETVHRHIEGADHQE